MYWSLLSMLEELIKVLGACTLPNNYIFNCVVLVSHWGLTGYSDIICQHKPLLNVCMVCSVYGKIWFISLSTRLTLYLLRFIFTLLLLYPWCIHFKCIKFFRTLKFCFTDCYKWFSKFTWLVKIKKWQIGRAHVW
jgi:hypothetical protein